MPAMMGSPKVMHRSKRHFGFRNFYLHGKDGKTESEGEWGKGEEQGMYSLGGLGRQDWEAALTVPLPVAQAPHGLHLRLEGPPLVPVPEVAWLQEVLVPAVARILIADPAGREARRTGWRWPASLPGTRTPARTSQLSTHPCHPLSILRGLGSQDGGVAPLSWLCPFLELPIGFGQ